MLQPIQQPASRHDPTQACSSTSRSRCSAHSRTLRKSNSPWMTGLGFYCGIDPARGNIDRRTQIDCRVVRYSVKLSKSMYGRQNPFNPAEIHADEAVMSCVLRRARLGGGAANDFDYHHSMNRTRFSNDSVPLSTRLLDTRECLQLSPQINEFENSVFGPDFACDEAQIRPWIDSGCLFYAAVCGEAVPDRPKIFSVLSVFLTNSLSQELLVDGRILECELMPWTDGPRSAQPSIYFSSVISDAPHHLAKMYASLGRDVEEFRDKHGLSLPSGFGIACGSAGRRHMEYNGFQLLDSHHYRDKYDLLTITHRTAKTEFWHELLLDGTACLRASNDGRKEGRSIPADGETLLVGRPDR